MKTTRTFLIIIILILLIFFISVYLFFTGQIKNQIFPIQQKRLYYEGNVQEYQNSLLTLKMKDTTLKFQITPETSIFIDTYKDKKAPILLQSKKISQEQLPLHLKNESEVRISAPKQLGSILQTDEIHIILIYNEPDIGEIEKMKRLFAPQRIPPKPI